MITKKRVHEIAKLERVLAHLEENSGENSETENLDDLAFHVVYKAQRNLINSWKLSKDQRRLLWEKVDALNNK
jgi:hypothetical protein